VTEPVGPPREVTFTIDFPTVTSVASFLAELDEDFPERTGARASEQTLEVTFVLAPSREVVEAMEQLLAESASAFGGEMLGWELAPAEPFGSVEIQG
jgi:hypothetical protein